MTLLIQKNSLVSQFPSSMLESAATQLGLTGLQHYPVNPDSNSTKARRMSQAAETGWTV